MSPWSSPPLSETATALCTILILLVPFSVAGVALLNTGLNRSRSAAQTMLASLSIVGVAAITYFVVGFAVQGLAGQPEHSLSISGKAWGWIGAERLFLRGVKFDGSRLSLVAWFQLMSVGLAAVIPFGAGSDRWRLGPSLASTALFAGWTYPLFAHWVWGGGWLVQLGANYGLGRGFLDAGGSSCIQVSGGLTALSMAWILGPRRGKYSPDGMTAAIPGHNAVIAVFGCLLALVGWLALNSAGAILFSNAEIGRVALVAINTTLCAAAAGLTTAAVTSVRLGKPDASLTANGWIGGLAASSAACAFILPAAAVIVGMIAGILVPFAVELFELRLAVDDPGGAISAHGVAGLWGVLAAGIFSSSAVTSNTLSGSGSGQLLAQVIGMATLLGLVLPMTYGLNWSLNRIHPQRVAGEGEWQGMDLHELGAGAYPEFVTHREDSFQRWSKS